MAQIPTLASDIEEDCAHNALRFRHAIALIDAANADDPNEIEDRGRMRPAELVYGERMSKTLNQLYPDASELLSLAARAQHICRWTVPRNRYPDGRIGYLRWRTDLKKQHADHAGAILLRSGYEPDEVERVRSLIRKERLKTDPEAQALEDVACIVFLEHYFVAFAAKHDRDNIIAILRKTWAKMSAHGHASALALEFDPAIAGLIALALDGE